MDHWTADIYHNLFMTLLLEIETKTMLAKQPWCIQTKMYRLSRKMTIWSFF